MARTGRPSKFNQRVATRICDLIACTPRGLDAICEAHDDLPSSRTVQRWLEAHPDFCRNYLRARELQADLIFDECLTIADDSSGDSMFVGAEGEEREVCNTEFVQRAKLRIDTRMRMAGKLAPKKYGEKTEVEHVGGVTMTHVVDRPPEETREQWLQRRQLELEGPKP